MDKIAIYLQSICETYPDFSIETVRVHNEDGQFNDVLFINEEYVFRFPRYSRGIESLAIETAILRHIQAYVTLSVPNPTYISNDKQTIGRVFMGYRIIPGEVLWKETLTAIGNDNVLQRFAEQIVNFLIELHSVPVEMVGMTLPLSDGLNEWTTIYADVRRYLFPYMRLDIRERIANHFEAFLTNSQLHLYTPCLRHGDVGPGNILYDSKTQTICGVIDFSFANLGDPALDIAAISCYGEPFFEQFCHVYPGVESLVERAQFYRGTFALQEALYGFFNNDNSAFESGMAQYDKAIYK